MMTSIALATLNMTHLMIFELTFLMSSIMTYENHYYLKMDEMRSPKKTPSMDHVRLKVTFSSFLLYF